MIFYEVENGFFGQSHVRVYVWAANLTRALELAAASFERDGQPFDKMKAVRLFEAGDQEFATRPCDVGFTPWQIGETSP